MPESAPTRFDAVVVGAGPAGSAVAIQLARAGWSVALVERQRFPRRKVCGECVAASNLPLLEALGIGAAVDERAGAPLRHVALWHGDGAVQADLPAADRGPHPWGRALGREALDTLLLEQAHAAGAVVMQPCAVQAIDGAAGAWRCQLRLPGSATPMSLAAAVVVNAHGSWEDLPSDRPERRRARGAADLFAFKANFARSPLPVGTIGVLTLDGGYGGMVVADQGMTTIACCVRRDRLSGIRATTPGLSAGDAVEAWLHGQCEGVRQALLGAVRDGPWLSSGPLDPGVRLDAAEGIFRVGNAAGEAHPILGEGMSMALQSAALLCSHLLRSSDAYAVPDAAAQARVQRAYTAHWRREFALRLRLAAVFAHLAMRPVASAVLMRLVGAWPGLLTHGARWGGKTRTPRFADAAVAALAHDAAP